MTVNVEKLSPKIFSGRRREMNRSVLAIILGLALMVAFQTPKMRWGPRPPRPG